MAETSSHRAVHGDSSGHRPSCTDGDRPPPLQRSRSPRDLISALPEAVIHHVFSFLPLQDVVKTSVLSKRWRSTWTTTTRLVFEGARSLDSAVYYPYYPYYSYNSYYFFDSLDSLDSFAFPSIVDRVLIQCTSPKVKEFHVNNFKYVEANRPKLDLWLRFVEGRRVEELRLWLFVERHGVAPPSFYILPRLFYCSSWLVRLEVRFCCFSLGRTIRWPRLKVLLIESAELSDDILAGIFKGSPALESLELRGCSGLKNIIIDSTSVKELVLIDPVFSNTDRIWAPHLLSLRVSGDWPLHSVCRLDDISSLMEAELDFRVKLSVPGDKRFCCDLLKELFKKLRRVPTITFGCWCLQILSLLEMERASYPISRCQNLILHAPVSEWDLPGIAYMLRSSRRLRKLVIHSTGSSILKYELDEESREHFNFDRDHLLRSWKGKFQCLAKHLKRVEIVGLGANQLELEHLLAPIKFLLDDTLALENMILFMSPGQERPQAAVLSEILDGCRDELRCRRVSRNAVVICSHPFESI